MPKVKVLSVIERINPATKQMEQIQPGVLVDVTDEQFRFFKKRAAVELVQEQAKQPADVSNVVAAAEAAPKAEERKGPKVT